MRRATVSITLVCLTLVSLLNAQTGSLRVTVPSPTAASLGRFGDVPVSLYSGTPDISIPLWTLHGRALSLPIVMKYHGGGVRVEEIGGWAGIGWALEAGGVITRTVRGLVDELPGGYYTSGTTWYDPNNWPTVSSTLIQNIANWSQDGEPDQFFFDFAGRSGQFVMGPTSTSTSLKEVRTIPYQDLQINPTFGSGGITSWAIVAEDGTRYTFGAIETNTDYNESLPIATFPDHYQESYTSSWHMTGIKTVGGDSITLYYTPYAATHRHAIYREKFDFVSPANCVPDEVQSFNEYEVQTQRLDSIVAAQQTIRFYQGTTLRTDALSPTGAQQEPRLDLIKVTTPSGVVLRKFQFQHDYSTGRLTLMTISEQDRNNVSLPPYSFTYNSQALPATSSYAQDLWGFYNGQTSNTTSIPYLVSNATALSGAGRSPNGTYAQAGILTRITYPTGGYNEFVWEGNDYPAYGEGVELVYIAQTWGPSSVQFTIGGSVAVVGHIYRAQSPDNCDGQFTCPFTTFDGGNQSWQWSSAGSRDLSLSPGVTYTITANPGLGVPDSWSQIQVSWREIGPMSSAPAGGVRIAELRTADALANVTIHKYRYRLQSDPNVSSGRTSFDPTFWYDWGTGSCAYTSRSSVSKLTLGSGGAIGYGEVEVWNGGNGEFGKTRHWFRSAFDAADGVDFALGSSFVFNAGNTLPFVTPTVREWKRGQEREALDYNATGQPQRHVKSTFAFRDEGTAEPVTTRRFRGVSISHFTAARWGPALTYVYSPFEVISAWSYLSEDTSVVYGGNGADSALTNRSYAYANPLHLQLTQLTEANSNGTQRITRMKYPADYATGTGSVEAAAITAMQGAAHIHDALIERLVVDKTGGIEHVVQGDVTTWKEYAPGQFRPFQRFVLNSPSPLP